MALSLGFTDSSSQESSQGTQTPPEYAQKMQEANLGLINMMTAPFLNVSDQRLAGFNADQLAAFDMTAQNAVNQMAAPQIYAPTGQVNIGAPGAGGFGPGGFDASGNNFYWGQPASQAGFTSAGPAAGYNAQQAGFTSAGQAQGYNPYQAAFNSAGPAAQVNMAGLPGIQAGGSGGAGATADKILTPAAQSAAMFAA